jgi:hypothetical protein
MATAISSSFATAATITAAAVVVSFSAIVTVVVVVHPKRVAEAVRDLGELHGQRHKGKL